MVAIKRLKTMFLSEDAVREFEKEVDMLDKFRCDFVVHFYGACLIQTTLLDGVCAVRVAD